MEPKDWIYVKDYGFLSFAKNIGKNLSGKFSQKFLDSAKKFTTCAIKTASKREIQKAEEAIGDLIGKRIADKKIMFQNLIPRKKKCNTNGSIYITWRKTRNYW